MDWAVDITFSPAYQLFFFLQPSSWLRQVLLCMWNWPGWWGTFVICEDKGSLPVARDVETKSAVSDDLVHVRSLITLWKGLEMDRRPCDTWSLPSRRLWGSFNTSLGVYQSIACDHYYDNRRWTLWRGAWKHAAAALVLSVNLLMVQVQDTEAWKWPSWRSRILGIDATLALEYMGYGYLRRGDYLNAYRA